MITIRIYRKDNQIVAFELSGHADSGPYGYDLVCAGVSAVSFGAVNAIHELCEIDLEIRQADEGGYLYVCIPSSIDDEANDKAQLLLESMLISLNTIERDYGEFIKMESQ
ncbi:MAG TPA: ribosomal-processing cysteine protease Prp [Virgibacillus sp.]|nr:ribosomal-processing cysteine protease Prp [Virgibacillus sp.]